MDFAGPESIAGPISRPISPRPQWYRSIYLVLALAIGLAGGGGSALRFFLNQDGAIVTPPRGNSLPEHTSGDLPSSPSLFRPRLLSTSLLADPALLSSTPRAVRLSTVVAGRIDPFSSILAPGSQGGPGLATPLPSSSSTAAIPVVALANPPSTPAELPLPPGVIQAEASTPVVNAGAVAPTAPSPALNLMDQLTINGIAQVGNQVSVIVTEAGQTAGRRVKPGETLLDGQVRLKKVDLSGAEPQIVLTYGSRDYRRSVGVGLIMGQR